MVQTSSSLVLYVDPDSDDREEVAESLTGRRSGLSVVEASTLEEARSRLERGDIACVVSEYALPDATGLDLLEVVRDGDPNIPFVFYTSHPASDLVEEAFRAGATDYVEKGPTPAHHRILERRLEIATATGEKSGVDGSLAAERSRRSLDEYRTVFETLRDEVFLLDVEDGDTFRIARVNAAEDGFLGCSAEDPRGKTLYDLYDEDVADEAVAEYRRCLERRAPTTSENAYRLAGETRVFRTELAPVISAGEVTQLVGVTREITDRRERERELRGYREYIGTVLDSLDDVFYVLDDDGVLKRWNESLPRETGYTDEEIAEMRIQEFFDEGESDRIDEALREVFETGRAQIESELLTERGARIPYEFVATEVEEPTGDTVAAGIGRNVSRRVEKEHQLSRLISNVPGFVYRVRNAPDWPVEFVSDGAREITGYDPETLERGDVSLGEELVLEGNDRIWRQVQAALDAEEPFDVTYPLETESGDRRWVREQGRGVFAADGSVEALEGVVIDITEQVEYERELERTQRLLEQSQRLANVGAWEIQVEDGALTGLTATDEAYRIHGLSPETDVDIQQAFGYYHPEDEIRVRAGVDRAVREGESYDYEAQLTTANGDERWVRTIGEPIREDGDVVAVRGAIQDITERKQREVELERTKSLLDNTEQIANVGGWELDAEGGPPFDGIQTDGLHRLHGISPGEEFPTERGMEFVHPDDREKVEEAVEGLLVDGKPFDIERRIVTIDGDVRWVHGRGVPVVEDGAIVRYRGAMADITERKRSERTFSSLYDAAHRLLAATADEDVAQITVEAAVDLLELPQIVLYRFDSDENRFVPLAHSLDFESSDGVPPVIHGSDRSLVGRAFFGDETLELNDVRDSPYLYDAQTPIRKALVIPLGEHGVLAAGDPVCGEFDAHTRTVTELLGTTVRAAFDRLTRERELQERQRELEQKTTQLERLNQLNELIRGIDRRLVQAESRDDLEAAVCEKLVASDRYAFAWIGEYDTRTQTVAPRSWAGTDRGYLDEIRALSTDEATVSEPAHRTARACEPTLVSNVAEGVQKQEWRREALSRGYQSVFSVPLLHEAIPYGVLTVYAAGTDAFDPLARTVFEELGEAIANTVNNVETKQGLVADQVVELELRAYATNEALHRLASDADCSLTVETVLPESDDRYRVFFTTPADAADALRTAAASSPSVEDVRVLSADDERATFQATVFETPVALTLAEQGAVPRRITTDGETMEMTVEVPTTTDIRTFVEVLQARYPDVELIARRELDRPIQTREELYRSLTACLTDRQFEVLTAAYHGGYFESPRSNTGEEIAELLGITQPTFNYHLRRAFKRLLSLTLSKTGGVKYLDT
ncbi:PAS domain S-box-containing protein [Halopelagius inordinatus]|uniref:histidine kinase n=1 Tax=Halopelagius inordinatus TaxID=553467 RepID=A0A1I2PC01_9EURY|nr:PAS domain S-box protein [Halopelagius inordinatus]SFG10971.1 PAS domain S-box-containing protein [Halopelagius inordinatus]